MDNDGEDDDDEDQEHLLFETKDEDETTMRM
jgi:hypothetical protein